jgi:hypothetical protein
MADAPVATGQGPDSLERPPVFIPTPERLAPYLGNLKVEEIDTQLRSVDGRRSIFEQLKENEHALKQDLNGSFRPELLEEQLHTVGETLAANDRYLAEMHKPERQGLFRRAWETVKRFPRKHPVVTTIGLLALLAGGVAGGLYLSGYFQLAQAGVAAEAIKDFIQGSDVVNRGIGEMPDFNPYHGVPPGF